MNQLLYEQESPQIGPVALHIKLNRFIHKTIKALIRAHPRDPWVKTTISTRRAR